MSLTSTRHRFTVFLAGKPYRGDLANSPVQCLTDIEAQCSLFCEEAFGPVDPVKSVCALIKAGEAIAPLMSRDEIGRLIGVLEEKMRSRARTT